MSDPIREIQTFHVEVPLPRPLRIGGMEIARRQYCVVRIAASSGEHGVAYGLTRNAPIAETVERTVAPIWIGGDLANHDALYDRCVRGNVCLGTNGVFWRALSIFDCALYDLLARKAGLPLGEYLGGESRPVRTLLVGGYPAPDETPESLADQVRAMTALDADGVKIASCGDPERDTRRLRTCREALGDAVPLMIDLFWQIQDAAAFAKAARPWRELALGWIEDPVAFDDHVSLETLKRELGLTIAMGDEQTGLRAFERLLAPGRVDVLRLDATVCGGVRGFLKAAAMARERGRPVAGHMFDQLHRQLASAAPNVEWIERMPEAFGLDSAHLLWTNPAQPGARRESTRLAGIGIEWDWDAINHHRTR